MKRKLTAALTALIVAAATLAPATASADHRRGQYYGSHGAYGHHGGYYRGRDDDDGEAVAAGVIGLVLGLAIGSAAQASRRSPRYGYNCYDNYQRCAPPPCDQYRPCGPVPGYYNQGYNQGYYDPRYSPDYGLAGGYYPPQQPYYGQPSGCVRTERQWDRYANRYVTIEIPC